MWREAQRDQPGGVRDAGGKQPCQQTSLTQAGARGLPPDPQTHLVWMGVMIPAHPAPPDPTGSRQVQGFLPKLMEDTARERCVIFAMLTSRNQASRLKGLYRICLSKGWGMLSLRIKLEGQKTKGREQVGGSYSGWSSCSSHPPPAQVFPLIRKALCKSSYSEIRGSKKDCNGGMLQSASTAISVIRWKASWITQTERTSVLCVFSGCPQV